MRLWHHGTACTADEEAQQGKDMASWIAASND